MIYTVTLNPSIDVYSNFSEFEVGKINRPENQKIVVGGKGINVSKYLLQLGVPSIPIVVVGGFVGDYIVECLSKDFKPVVFHQEECSRICYKIQSSCETAINPRAHSIGHAKEQLKIFLRNLDQSDILIVSGSGVVEDYQEILNQIRAKLVLDLSGKELVLLSHLHTWIVKPNQEELAEIELSPRKAYDRLLEQAEVILNTQGSGGATLVTSQIMYHLDSFGTDLKSTVGCGDAFLAGFIKSYLENQSIISSFHFANEFAYKMGKKSLFKE